MNETEVHEVHDLDVVQAAPIQRPDLIERGLSDPLEFFYQHIDEFSEAWSSKMS